MGEKLSIIRPTLLGSAVNSSIDKGEFRAMKTLSDRIAPRCNKRQFCDKMTAYLNCFRDIVVEHCGLKKEEKNGTFATTHFLRLAVFRMAFENLYESC